MTLYHGSKDIVEYPEIRKARFNKDFYFGFYCTNIEKQAERWATRYGEKGYINRYEYTENTELKISESVIQRSRLYGKTDSTDEIKTINAELQKFRKDMRMCNNIFQDIETIREHQKTVELLEREASKHSDRKLYQYQRCQ